MEPVVRLQTLTIKNIKNVGYGKIEMPNAHNQVLSYENPEILGLYGQNGSGKTAVVDVLYFLQHIMLGNPFPDNLFYFISTEAQTAEISADFAIFNESDIYEVNYTVVLERCSQNVIITQEKLKYAAQKDAVRNKSKLLIEYNRADGDKVFKPASYLDSFPKSDKLDLLVARKLSEKTNSSYIFNENSRNIFIHTTNNKYIESALVIENLFKFALKDLFVICNQHSGVISANLLLPMAFRIDDKGVETVSTKGDFPVSLLGPTIIPLQELKLLKKIILQINIVLKTIIPNMNIDLKNYGNQSMDDGRDGVKVELISLRNTTAIPLRMESEGIIKLISILNALIQAFANPSICLAIDELDAGIFEYMLGELLSIFEKTAKGQLIFTSHNLRALEMLKKESIMFSTTNPEKRYIHIKNIKATNNLRNVYLRSITLGGQEEEIYQETDSLQIARAFRKAGRGVNNG